MTNSVTCDRFATNPLPSDLHNIHPRSPMWIGMISTHGRIQIYSVNSPIPMNEMEYNQLWQWNINVHALMFTNGSMAADV